MQGDGVDGFDVVVRVARLGPGSSGERVEMLHGYGARAAAAYAVPDTAVILDPEGRRISSPVRD